MQDYQAPLRDMRFVMFELFDSEAFWASLPGTGDLNRELADAVLEEAARITGGLLAPLNRSGDEEGVRFDAGHVITPAGFREAWRTFAEGGWVGLAGNPEYGGQGLPKSLTLLFEEMLHAAGNSFALYAVLTSGAALLLDEHADESTRAFYLPRLYSGEWTGVMCLTEAHAGTDLGLIRTRAEPCDDGRYAITGTKIFITGGQHDLTDNIVHLVLARLPDAPAGTRGISLFLVPRQLPDENGQPGADNGVSCGAVEHKMGIHASATCVIHYDAAHGWLVGEPHRGLAAMFTMMNYERLSVGLQGLGCAEMAWQQALAYARERLQGRAPGSGGEGSADPIIAHPDVRRMLLTQKALIEGGRAFAAWTGRLLDESRLAGGERRERAATLVALLTPIAKAFMTDMGLECCVLAQQVFGGHGYVREWGVEQLVRDVRISQIYEGTNGVQAMDLVTRKLVADEGRGMTLLLEVMREDLGQVSDVDELRPLASAVADALGELESLSGWLLAAQREDAATAGASAVEYLHVCGLSVYAWLWLRQAQVAARALQGGEDAFYRAKLETARFFMARMLPRCKSLVASIRAGAGALMALPAEHFD